MPFFRKKPVVVEAEQFFSQKTPLPFRDQGVCLFGPTAANLESVWHIDTLEGPLLLNDGDWVVKGTANEFYPVKPEIFKDIYEEVADASGAVHEKSKHAETS